MNIDFNETKVSFEYVGQRSPISASKFVYIVDDDSMVRRSLSLTLKTAGFCTRPFTSGQDFLDEVENLTPGCVLLDVRMPGLDGIAVLGELRKRSHRFAVITMTGHGDVDTVVKAMKSGAKDFLQKPFADSDLLQVVDEVLSNLLTQVAGDDKSTLSANQLNYLTVREREVLQGLVSGFSNKEMAKRMGISVRTVEMHRARLMDRLKAKTVAEAVRVAILAGIEPID